MNVTLRQLHAFIAVAQTGSFTLAAERLFVTQSALSGLIRELESSLGLRLFDRSTRRLRLSVIGQELYPQIEKILHDLEGVVSEAGNLKALQRGKVRIAVPQLLACTLLPQVMADFKALHPGVQLRMVDCAVESVMARVFSGEVDIGIGPERETNSDIEAAELFTLPFMVVLPKGHPLAAQEQVRWQDLSAQPLITLQGQFTDLLVSDAGRCRPRPAAGLVHASDVHDLGAGAGARWPGHYLVHALCALAGRAKRPGHAPVGSSAGAAQLLDFYAQRAFALACCTRIFGFCPWAIGACVGVIQGGAGNYGSTIRR